MSAAEIIEEIKRLPPKERARVKEYLDGAPEAERYASDKEAESAGREVVQNYDGLLRKLAQ